MKKFIVSILLIINIFKVSAQTDSLKQSYVSAAYKYGVIYAHYDDFKYFIEDYVRGVELNYGFRSTGEKLWQRIYHYPEIGVGYTFINFGNPDVLGSAHAAFTYVNLPLIERKKCLFTAKFAVGVGYLNKPFDLYDNKYNIAIGSYINAYLNINFDIKYTVYKQWKLIAGFGLSHFSNGGTTKPNKGINLFLPSLGFSYDFQKKAVERPDFEIPEFEKNIELSIIYAAAYSSIEPANPDKYFASDISVNFERQFSYKGRYGIGLDLFYDNSLSVYVPGSMDEPEISNIGDLIYAGGHISYDFVFGRTSFTVQIGAYFFQGQKFNEELYNRFGLKYRFAEHWVANLTLKTYWAKAKFPEFGIGYRLGW